MPIPPGTGSGLSRRAYSSRPATCDPACFGFSEWLLSHIRDPRTSICRLESPAASSGTSRRNELIHDADDRLSFVRPIRPREKKLLQHGGCYQPHRMAYATCAAVIVKSRIAGKMVSSTSYAIGSKASNPSLSTPPSSPSVLHLGNPSKLPRVCAILRSRADPENLSLWANRQNLSKPIRA